MVNMLDAMAYFPSIMKMLENLKENGIVKEEMDYGYRFTCRLKDNSDVRFFVQVDKNSKLQQDLIKALSDMVNKKV